MDIDRIWSRKKDYTKAFTVTVDELNTLKKETQQNENRVPRPRPAAKLRSGKHSP